MLFDVLLIMFELFGDGVWCVFNDVDLVLLFVCGGSYYVVLIVKYWIESIVKLLVSVEIVSEFCYCDSVLNLCMLVVVVL